MLILISLINQQLRKLRQLTKTWLKTINNNRLQQGVETLKQGVIVHMHLIFVARPTKNYLWSKGV